jgi:F420-dependent oxidoreductase-like protein
MKFGVFAPQGWRMDLKEIADPVEQFEAMINVARVAEEGNWDSVWVYDHFHTVPTPEIETTFECWTATTALARATSRVKVGQMVGCNGYRNPALYAKIASTVDVASHGRLLAGIGAGWYEHEWKAYGYPWVDTPVRMGMFREAVQIVHKMWTEVRPAFAGKYYSIDGAINEPKSAKPGRKIPLWIGGGGEQVTLKLVAQYGDACNVGGGNAEVCQQKLEVLKGHCETVGRDYGAITKSTSLWVHLIEPGDDPDKATASSRGNQSYEQYAKLFIVGSTEDVARRVEQIAHTDIDYVIVYVARSAYEPDLIRTVDQEVVARFS